MEINYLCEFAVIAKLSSFSMASEELCISQSSLSKHIKSLENELGVQLFDRSTRNVVISEYGKLILPLAEQLIEINDSIQSSVYDYINKDRRQLHITSIPVMAQYNITGMIAKFQQKYPSIKLIVSENEGSEIPRLLEEGTYEVAFFRKVNNNTSKYQYLDYRSDTLCALLPKTHVLATATSIALTQLKEEQFLFLDKKTLLYGLCYDACVDAGFIPNVTYTGHRPENIIDLTSQGAGISLLMKQQSEFFNNPNISCVDIVPAVRASVCLIKMKNRKLSYAGNLFWDFVKSNIV